MLKFGTVTNINPLTARAKVQFAEDNMSSYWLPIIQKKTLKDKYYSVVDIGEQVACLMDENDGSLIEYNKETKTLTISAKTVNIIADVYNRGKFENTEGIKSSKQISDATSTMQRMREIYNSHTHPDKNQKTSQTM